ncbi:MAG: hypothetical protein IK129_05205 [Deltaproteobacteria bacterium]|nr:hypothetical protein [Deltaproteobacteria bacterium]
MNTGKENGNRPGKASCFVHRLQAALLCGLLFFPAVFAGIAEAAVNKTHPENLELRYLEWQVDYGEEMPAGVSPHPWRRLSASAMQDRLNIFLKGPSTLVWYGTPPGEELAKLKAAADRLLREYGTDWSGQMERKDFDKLNSGSKKCLCVWRLVALYNAPGGRDTVREIRLQGADRGDNPRRLACETPFAAYVEALMRRLHETAPKTPRSLVYWAEGAEGGLYSLNTGDEGQAHVSRLKQGKEEESEVDPAIVGRVAEIARRHKANAWHFFAPPGWHHKTPGASELTLTYDTGQELWIRALRGSADRPSLPAGFPAFERDLLAALDEALDGPPQAGSAQDAPPRQGLQRLLFSQSGMSYESCITYRVNTRREAGRDVFRLMRRMAGRVTECALSDEDLAALETLLVQHKVAAWDGFKGSNRNVLDGNSFSRSLSYTNGRKVSAGGYMRFPQGYGEAEKAIRALLDGILEKSGAPVRETRR